MTEPPAGGAAEPTTGGTGAGSTEHQAPTPADTGQRDPAGLISRSILQPERVGGSLAFRTP